MITGFQGGAMIYASYLFSLDRFLVGVVVTSLDIIRTAAPWPEDILRSVAHEQRCVKDIQHGCSSIAMSSPEPGSRLSPG